MKTALIVVLLAASSTRAYGQTLEAAGARFQELARAHELDAARAALDGCVREIEAYRERLAARERGLRTLTEEAAVRDSFDYDWGSPELASALNDLEAKVVPPSGVVDSNALDAPLPAWWRLWEAHHAARAPEDEGFRERAVAARGAVLGALDELDRVASSSVDLYGALVRRGVDKNTVLSMEPFLLDRVSYRRGDLRKMLRVLDAWARGKRARMKDPADW